MENSSNIDVSSVSIIFHNDQREGHCLYLQSWITQIHYWNTPSFFTHKEKIKQIYVLFALAKNRMSPLRLNGCTKVQIDKNSVSTKKTWTDSES